MKFYFSALLIFISFLYCSAQNRYTIAGNVVNRINNPVAFANVALFSLPDSIMVKGVMTDTQGNFILLNISPDDYYLKILFIGFETKEVKGIHLKDHDVVIPTIQLKRKATRLTEVTVVSGKGMFETEAGKMIYNVDGNVNAVGETASELLQNIPSVGTNMDDKVTVRGSKATILIDGVESDLSSMIDQIPASAIESIEVITNPSVRYDAKSGGSIINIKLKQQAQKGYNAKVEAGLGTMNQKNLNAVIGYNLKNWRFSGMMNYRDKENKSFQNSVRKIIDSDSKDELNQVSDNRKKPSSLFSSLKAAYFFKDKSFIDLKYITQNKKQADQKDTKNKNFKEGELHSVSEIHKHSESDVTFNQLSSSFRKFFGNENHELDGNFLYSFNAPENQSDQLYQPFFDSIEGQIGDYRTNNKSYINHIRLFKGKLDYTWKLSKKFKLETGTLFSINNFSQDLTGIKLNYNWDNVQEQYMLVADTLLKSFSNIATSGSAYLLFSGTLGKLSFSSGVRFEYVKNKIVSDSTITTEVIKFVPSVHIQKTVSEKYSWELSMTARTTPPSYNQLNPISFSWGTYSKSSGNPNLKPEFFYQLEFDNVWKWDKSNMNLDFFFKNETQVIGRWYFLEEEDGNLVSHSIYENLGNIYSYGVDVSSVFRLKKIVFRPGAVVYYQGINGDKFGPKLDRSEISYIFKLNASYPLSKKISTQLSGTYNSLQISDYGKQSGYYQVDMGMRSKVFKNKGSIVLKVMDVFNSVEYNKIVNQRVNYLKETFYDPQKFLVYLSFSYKFNSLTKAKSSGKKRSGKS